MTTTTRIQPGQRVRHPRHGYGTVKVVNASGTHATVRFGGTNVATLKVRTGRLEVQS